jgi:aminoglycoside phosphotransferase (APT) family kinase protein
MGDSALLLPDDLLAWVADTGGGRVTSATRKPGGARKEAWFVDVSRPDGVVRELFLHYDRSDRQATADPWTLHREATVCLALQDTPVPVARVIGVHHAHQAMLSERLVGENWFSRLADPAEREETARDFMVRLAALHRLNPARLRLPGFPAVTTIADAVRHELDEWDALLAARGGEPDPALAFTLGWLRRHIPEAEGPVVLVQGDTGPGNFMFASGRVVAIVDWELAHLGDAMEDIAWLSLRAAQEPFTDFPARLRDYEDYSGSLIDEARVRYYQVMAEAKLQVMSHRPAAGPSREEGAGRGDIGNGFIYGTLHRRLWLEALAVPTGLDLTPAETPPPRAAGDHTWMYDAILEQLRQVVVPGLSDPLAQARGKGLARLIKYLARVDADGPFFAACEHDDLEELLGRRPGTVAEGRTRVAEAVRSGRLTDEAYLRYLWRRVARETELARPAMGVLADRHWPPLTSGSARD